LRVDAANLDLRRLLAALPVHRSAEVARRKAQSTMRPPPKPARISTKRLVSPTPRPITAEPIPMILHRGEQRIGQLSWSDAAPTV